MSQDDVDSTVDNSKADDEVLRVARERFDVAVDAESDIRKLALEDLSFSAGEQWPDDVKRQRDSDRRPCLTINRLPQFIRQITNDQKQNRPSIKVSPVDDKATTETAKIYQGLIQHIEYSSNADTAYDTAFDRAVRSSFGYFRIVTEYCDPTSFDQEIRFKRIRNPFSIYLDPNYQEPDGSDANWGFVFEDMSRDEYEAQYPESKAADMTEWDSIGNTKPGWASKSQIRVAEYFYKDYRSAEVVQLSNGDSIEEANLPKDDQGNIVLPAGIELIAGKKRTAQIPEIKWCKINAIEILEKRDWPGQWIPIVPVLGEELDIDGKRVLEGVVRHAKDPQRMYNYWKSSETETIALAPRAPFIGVAGQFEGFEAQWKTANIRNHAYLEYNGKSINGQPAGPPTRNVYEPPVQAISQASAMAADDLKATTGIYDSALGSQSRETSGIAIQRRNSQAQTSNFHFHDNLAKSIRHGGRICIDLIPHIYDAARAIRVLHPDGQEEIVMINQAFNHNGKDVNYRLDVGKYDVAVDTGPSFETKRQEAAASIADLVRAYPQMMQSVGDLLVKNLDWPGADEIAERMRKTLPPNLQADDKNKNPIPPQVQAQMQQMGQLIDQLTGHLKQKTELIEQKTLDLESKERIEMAKLKVELEIEMARMGSQEAMLAFKEELLHIRHRMDLLNFNQPIEQQEDGSGAQGAAQPSQDQQPTGGQQSPGQYMGS